MFSTRMNAGCNLICTALHHTFNRLFEEHVPAGTQPFIDHVTCQVDNCGSENKNHILIGYLGSLVGRRIIGSVSVQSCLWVIPILRSIRRFPGEIRVPWCVRRKKVCSFVLSLIPSILYTVSSLNVHHLRHDQSTFHLAPVLLKHIPGICVSPRFVGTAFCTQNIHVWCSLSLSAPCPFQPSSSYLHRLFVTSIVGPVQ